MSSLPVTRLTPEEFLEKERTAEQKHEYRYGEVFAVAGGSVPRSFVISNVQVALAILLRGHSFLYRQMPSMREIPTMIEHYTKLFNSHRELEVITDRPAIIQLPNLNQALPVAEIYRGIEILSA